MNLWVLSVDKHRWSDDMFLSQRYITIGLDFAPNSLTKMMLCYVCVYMHVIYLLGLLSRIIGEFSVWSFDNNNNDNSVRSLFPRLYAQSHLNCSP